MLVGILPVIGRDWVTGCSGTGAKLPAIWTRGSEVLGSGCFCSCWIKVVSTKSRAVAAAFCRRFHLCCFCSSCCFGNVFVMGWFGFGSFVGITVVGLLGWYCLGKGSVVWSEHEILFWEVDLFFFKVIEFDLDESLKGEEYDDDDPSLVLIHVFDEAVDVAIVMIIVLYFDFCSKNCFGLVGVSFLFC